ncbi:exodeoxyribonuclease III [Helicobacter pylori]|uniref:exodeoxyribonuclease III n=1 Tax=Helicobacter pylori TaxID=210 RepID=UPI000EB13537|nr:exodeoxyribonuclease III [Helicobacter pylori]
MKLISWNVNGLRACMTKGFMDFFNSVNADVFCIQESKMQQEQNTFEFKGYFDFWNCAIKKGYSGVVTFTKKEPLSVSYGIDIEEHDKEGRVVTCEFESFYLVNVYTPNSQQALSRLNYRMSWEVEFKKFLKALELKKPVIVCGDLNVAHNEIDLENPKTNRKNAGFSDEEREKFSELLNAGFIDTFRYFYPNKEKAYTWWSYMQQARDKDIGWRIDYFLCSNPLKTRLKDALIYKDILGSDHCPVGLELV